MATKYQMHSGHIPDSEFQKAPHKIGSLGAATIITNLLEAHFSLDEICFLLNSTTDRYDWQVIKGQGRVVKEIHGSSWTETELIWEGEVS